MYIVEQALVADGQYEPAFDPADRSKTAVPFLAINDKTTAIAAIKFHKPAWDDVLIQTKLKESFEAISNSTLQIEALNYIENRADFLGKGLGTSWRYIIHVDDPATPGVNEVTSLWSSGDSSTVPRRRDPDRNIFGNVVGPGAYKWGLKNLKANPPSQSWFDSYKSQFP
jgi:hypothetical protein